MPNIHLFKAANNGYCYDVNRNAVVRLNRKSFNALRDWINDNKEINDDATIQRLISEGYISNNYIGKIEHPMTAKAAELLANNIHMLILQVTQNCNLRCEYCVYSGSYINRHHSNKRMSFETARKAIDFYIQNSSQTDKLRFGFYGGEPTLEKELIEKCVDFIKLNARGKDTEFHITTNATLLDKEKMDFFVSNGFFITISLDGPKNIQDKNRKFANGGKGTFDVIMNKIEWLRQDYSDYLFKISFNSVLEPEDGFSETNSFFMTDSRITGMSVAASEKNDVNLKTTVVQDIDYNIARAYERFKVIYNYFRNIEGFISPIEINYLTSIKKNIVDIMKPDEAGISITHPGGPCVPGLQRLFVNADGFLFPCERVNEMADVLRIGDLANGIDIARVERLLNVGKISEDSCKRCWAFRFCTACAVFAEDGDTLSQAKRLSRCDYIKNSAEAKLKDYCVLKELGVDFDSFESEG